LSCQVAAYEPALAHELTPEESLHTPFTSAISDGSAELPVGCLRRGAALELQCADWIQGGELRGASSVRPQDSGGVQKAEAGRSRTCISDSYAGASVSPD
jgi:hypothetical protein